MNSNYNVGASLICISNTVMVQEYGSVLIGLSVNLYMLSIHHMNERLHNNFAGIKLHIIATITYILKMVSIYIHFL